MKLIPTSGQRRGCGVRKPGGIYLCVPTGPGGAPIEAFLVDPPVVIDAASLGVAAVGQHLVQHGGAWHVLDIVGREHYPAVQAFIEEARRQGISRRAPGALAFELLGQGSRLLLAHQRADIANALEFPCSARCPCERPEHLAEGYGGMCARLWAEEPLAGAQHRLAVFMSVAICQIEVVRDPTGGRHIDAVQKASRSALPVLEVER